MQAALRRATSTTYYAMFHALARNCADILIGKMGKSTSKHAWLQTYRALEHGFCKSQCSNKSVIQKFPNGIADFATTFVDMQLKRHNADYNPGVIFYRSECQTDLARVRLAIDAFDAESAKDKRAFAAFVMHKSRS